MAVVSRADGTQESDSGPRQPIWRPLSPQRRAPRRSAAGHQPTAGMVHYTRQGIDQVPLTNLCKGCSPSPCLLGISFFILCTEVRSCR